MKKKVLLCLMLVLLISAVLCGFTACKGTRINPFADFDYEIRGKAVVITKYNGNDTAVIIPNGTTIIGHNAFYRDGNLHSITIPSSVVNIEYEAFMYCGELTSVTFLENSKLKSIGDSAFCHCIKLENSIKSVGIIIPSSVTSIGDNAFAYCHGLELITFYDDSKLTNIGDAAFFDCKNLGSIVIPIGVENIGDSAFDYCNNLEVVFWACYSTKTEEPWNKIAIGANNEPLLIAEVYYKFINMLKYEIQL